MLVLTRDDELVTVVTRGLELVTVVTRDNV